jgi:hypothetical protein
MRDDSANADWHCGESSALAVFSIAFTMSEKQSARAGAASASAVTANMTTATAAPRASETSGPLTPNAMRSPAAMGQP